MSINYSSAGVSLPESVADHMYRMSMMAFLITDPLVNKDKLQKICLVHDLAESIVGDITPYDGITKEEKRKLEEVRTIILYAQGIASCECALL